MVYFLFRKYKNQSDDNQNELFFREFDKIKQSNQELQIFVSMLAKMILASENDLMVNLKDLGEKRLVKAMVEVQNREDFKMLRDQLMISSEVRKKVNNPNRNSRLPSPKKERIWGERIAT